MTFDTLRFPAVSPTAGTAGEGILLGRISASDMSAVVLESKVLPIVKVIREDKAGTSFTLVDETTAATNAAAGDFLPFGALAQMSLGDAYYTYVEDGKECDTMHVQIATPGVGTWELGIQEWDETASSWADMVITLDETNHFRAAAGVYRLRFAHNKKGALKLHHTDAAKHVWHRVYLKSFTSATTAPVISRLWASQIDFGYTDITSAINNGTAPAYEFLPEVGAHTDWIHPGPPIGLDVNVIVAAGTTYTVQRQYLASDDTWKPIPDLADPSNGYRNAGQHRIRWSRPADWVSKSYTFLGQTVNGWIERRQVTSVSTQGPVPLYQVQADSRSLGAANAQGLEYDSAVTYRSATFSIGDNQAIGNTILQLVNADNGATSTLTIPSAIEESSDLAAGKVLLSADFALAINQSVIVMCLSGGPLINLEVRLQ